MGLRTRAVKGRRTDSYTPAHDCLRSHVVECSLGSLANRNTEEGT